jgi:hypothetical protein
MLLNIKMKSKITQGGNLQCLHVKHYLESLIFPSLLLRAFTFLNSISSLEFLKEVNFPNGLPPPLDIAGKKDNFRHTFDN